MEHKIKETYSFEHKGIKIYIKIDYLNNHIDIIEPIDLNQGKFKKKEFIFIGRGVEYMNGWLLILQAMEEAIKDAKKKYEFQLAETSKFKEESIVKVFKVIKNRKY